MPVNIIQQIILNNIKTGHLLFLLLLVFTAVAYYPALYGRFLLDDFNNLAALEKLNSALDFTFIFGGSAGPSGRPLSLFTFALQHNAWPIHPFDFKLVNLIIHLLNGVLVYFITLFLFDYTGIKQKYTCIFTLIVSFLWLIQPVQISAVLYVIQRMTLLSSFFSLAGVLVYLHLWRSYSSVKNKTVLISGTVLFGVCMLLSVFSKENGILLPVLILAIEFTLLHWVKRPPVWKTWSIVFLILPLLLAIVYLALRFDHITAGYQFRPYSMGERLLTEARILFHYLYIIIFPHPSAFGLFHDDYVVSRGLFSPPTTFLSVVGIIGLLVIAVRGRKPIPVLAFSIFWFFGSHLLESTFINLELYFEHRNYLAVYGVCFLIAWFATGILKYISSRLISVLLIMALIISTAYVTCVELDLWSKPIVQAIEWQRRSPHSLRAMEDIGNLYINLGEGDKAIEVYDKMMLAYPDEVFPYIKEINIKECLQKTPITQEEWNSVLEKASVAKWHGFATIAEIYALTKNIQKGKCENINVYSLIKFIIILVNNPEYAHHAAILHELAAILSVIIGENKVALNNLDEALRLRPSSSMHILKVRILLEEGLKSQAEAAISDFREFLDKRPRLYIAYFDTLKIMENRLKKLGPVREENGASATDVR